MEFYIEHICNGDRLPNNLRRMITVETMLIMFQLMAEEDASHVAS